jgi:hypothetical protein
MQRFRKYAIGAGGMLVLVAAIVLATGSGSAVAAQISSVFVTNDASHAVPVREQALDGSNIRVHEEGTADVNVTNTSLSVAPQAPITSGGGDVLVPCGGGGGPVSVSGTATSLEIHMSSAAFQLFVRNGTSRVAVFNGPAFGAPPDIVLPLTRPIQFDNMICAPDPATPGSTGFAAVSWVGNN